jgi:hypothetical protein
VLLRTHDFMYVRCMYVCTYIYLIYIYTHTYIYTYAGAGEPGALLQHWHRRPGDDGAARLSA